MRIMPETRISSSQPVLWRVSVAGTLVAPWWHSGSVAEDRTGSGGAVPVLHYPALRCAWVLCVPVCACVLCVPVCVCMCARPTDKLRATTWMVRNHWFSAGRRD